MFHIKVLLLLVIVVKTSQSVVLEPQQDEVTVVPHIIWSNYPAFREVFYLIYRVFENCYYSLKEVKALLHSLFRLYVTQYKILHI